MDRIVKTLIVVGMLFVGSMSFAGCAEVETKDEILSVYNSVVETLGKRELTSNFKLQGKRDFGIDTYTGTYRGNYHHFSNTECLFGGTTIERKAGKEITLTCTLEINQGQAELFWRSGNEEEIVLLGDTGCYFETITLPEGANYIGFSGQGFTGYLDLKIE